MNDIFGIPVMVIRPGDQFHPGDGKTYIINLLEVKKALHDLRPDLFYDPWAWNVPVRFDVNPRYFTTGLSGV